jgi:biotin carboxylase
MKLTDEGPRIIEIAARLGGDYLCDFVEMIHKVDMVEAVLQIGLGEKPQIKQGGSSGIVKGKYLIPKSSGTIIRLDGIRDVERSPGVKSVKILSRKGDRVSVPPEGFGHIGWVVACGKSPIEVNKITNDALDTIKIEIH